MMEANTAASRGSVSAIRGGFGGGGSGDGGRIAGCRGTGRGTRGKLDTYEARLGSEGGALADTVAVSGMLTRRCTAIEGGPAARGGEARAANAGGAGDGAEFDVACDSAPPPDGSLKDTEPLLSISGTSSDAGDAIETGTGAGMSMDDARNKFSPPKRRAVVVPALETRDFLAEEETTLGGADEVTPLDWRRLDAPSSSSTMVRPNAVVVLGRLARRTGHDASDADATAPDASGSIESTAAADMSSSDCTDEEDAAPASGVAVGETSGEEVESDIIVRLCATQMHVCALCRLVKSRVS